MDRFAKMVKQMAEAAELSEEGKAKFAAFLASGAAPATPPPKKKKKQQPQVPPREKELAPIKHIEIEPDVMQIPQVGSIQLTPERIRDAMILVQVLGPPPGMDDDW